MSTLKYSELTTILNKSLKEVGRLRRGNNLTFHCPNCHHRKRKLEVCLDDPYVWHCWTCNIKGRGLYWLLRRAKATPELIRELENVVGEYSYNPGVSRDAFLDRIALLKTPKADTISPKVARYLPPEFKSLMDTDGSIEYRMAKKYANKRGLTDCDIIKYNIGYCSTGQYAQRLVFPSYDANNDLNYFSCRSYYDDIPYKYLNSDFPRNIVGFENMVDFDFPIYLCEGALDAISLKRNAIPLFGNIMSMRLRWAIAMSSCPEINVVLDDDALDKAMIIAEYINRIGKNVKLVRLSGKDPNVLGFVKTAEEIRNTNRLSFRDLMKIKLKL
jgi:hypothetical protein